MIEYHGGSSIVGADGPAPAELTPISSEVGVGYVFAFDDADGPIATTATSATYAGIYGLVILPDSGAKLLHDVTLTIDLDPAGTWRSYFFVGYTDEGWRVTHDAFSDSPDFVPDLALPTTRPAAPPVGFYAASYFDIYGPSLSWHVFSDAEDWFDVRVLTLANRATGGTATASKQKAPEEGAAQAFDGLTSTKWFASGGSAAWLQYQFGGGAEWAVVRYDVTSANDVADRDPKNWLFQGSHDGVTWTTLDTQTGVTFSARRQTKQFSVMNATEYAFYRLTVTATRGVGGGVQLAELALLAY